jgi:hypothetical protein
MSEDPVLDAIERLYDSALRWAEGDSNREATMTVEGDRADVRRAVHDLRRERDEARADAAVWQKTAESHLRALHDLVDANKKAIER